MINLSLGCLKHLAESISKGYGAMTRQQDCVAVNDFVLHWTPHGILVLDPTYLNCYLHNNGTFFLFRYMDTDDCGWELLNIGLFESDIKDGYLSSLLEMHHAILSRALMTSVPKCTKLMELAEIRLEELPERKNREEVKWLIY